MFYFSFFFSQKWCESNTNIGLTHQMYAETRNSKHRYNTKQSFFLIQTSNKKKGCVCMVDACFCLEKSYKNTQTNKIIQTHKHTSTPNLWQTKNSECLVFTHLCLLLFFWIEKKVCILNPKHANTRIAK